MNDLKINEEQVSNNELARMIAEGFRGVDEYFKDIEERMATKDDLIDLRKKFLEHILIVDQRVSTVQQGIVRVADYPYLEKRVEAVEETVETLKGRK